MGCNDILLSIIVPVYNVESYLSRCLDSLLSIKGLTFEIILVNDGSTDNSLQICLEYKDKYSCIKLVNQYNKGLSGARNSGLEMVRGHYISYIDSDDTVNSGTLEAAVSYMQEYEQCDMVQFPVQLNAGHESEEYICSGIGVRKGFDAIAHSFLVSREITWRVCDKLFRFSAIRDLRFIEGLVYEDNIYMSEFILRAQSVYLSSIGLYNYYWTPGSITRTKSSKHYEDMYHVHCLMYQTLSPHLSSRLSKASLLYIIANDAYVEDKYSSKSRKTRENSKLLRSIPLKDILWIKRLPARKQVKLLVAKLKSHF